MAIVFSMRFRKLLGACIVSAVLLGFTGCESYPSKAGVQKVGRAPRSYVPLAVRNSCFVESVHFCDFYDARRVGGPDGWARVLEWGDRQNDDTVRGGHAVAVYTYKNRLWVYDINHGFLSLAPPVGHRLDLTEVTPQIFKRYPQMKAALARYVDEVPQFREKNGPDYTRGATTQELHDALRVAVELGMFRPVRVVEFISPVDSYLRPCAATVFQYGDKLCLYSPSSGTRAVDIPLAGIDNLRLIQQLVRSAFPNAEDIKWFKPAKAVVIK